jgi:GTP 3',8-cyclase
MTTVIDRVLMPLLDVMVATACELRCVACTNGIGMLPRLHVFAPEHVEADVAAAAEVIHADVAVLLGGEPLGHRDLVRLMRFTRESGLADRVRVLTNGIRLHRMSEEFWLELEDLRVSIYPGKTPAANVELARKKQACHGFELSFYDVASDPFRAVHTAEERSPESARHVWEGCWYRHNTRKIEQGYFWRCCTSPSISKTLLDLQPSIDGIALAGLTPETLEEFLARDDPMRSCFRCFGNTGPAVEWSEERDRERWLAASAA